MLRGRATVHGRHGPCRAPQLWERTNHLHELQSIKYRADVRTGRCGLPNGCGNYGDAAELLQFGWPATHAAAARPSDSYAQDHRSAFIVTIGTLAGALAGFYLKHEFTIHIKVRMTISSSTCHGRKLSASRNKQ